MTRIGILTAVLGAALSGTAALAADVAPACGVFEGVSTPDGGEGTDLRVVDALDAANVWAVGHRWDPSGLRDGVPLAMRWDGSVFATEPIPDLTHLGTEPRLESVAIAPTGDAWVVGGVRDAITGQSVPLILRWSRGLWENHSLTPLSSFAARYPRLRDVAAVAEDDAWTIGEAETPVKGAIEPFAAHWDGKAWSEVEMPGTDGNRILTAISAAPGAVWAVGYDVDGVGVGARNTTYARVFHFKGGQWSIINTPAAAKAGSTLLDVVVVSANDVWAVGSAGAEGLFLHWDGDTWQTVIAPAQADPRSVSGRTANDVWAAGSKGHYRWNGKSWTFLPATSDGAAGARRAVAVGGPCDVWSVASTNLGVSSKSRVDRMSPAAHGQPPAPPVGLVAIPKEQKQIVLVWLPGISDPTGPVGQTAFVVERCFGTAAGCLTPFATIAKVDGTTTIYVDPGLASGTSYVYRVSAVNDFGTSEATIPVAAVTLPDESSPLPVPVSSTPGAGSRDAGGAESSPDTVPVPPFGPPAAPFKLSLKSGAREIALSWFAGNDPGPVGRTVFVIERCAGGGPDCVSGFVVIRKQDSSLTSFLDSGLQPSKAYTYRVSAVNDAGASPVTAPVTASTLAADPTSPLADAVPGTVVGVPYSLAVPIAEPRPPVAPGAPATPVDFAAKGASTKHIVLTWQSGGAPTGPVAQMWFVVERCAGASRTCVTFETVAKLDGTVTSYSDFAVKPASSYTYRVYALNKTGPSTPTAPATAATLPGERTGSAS